jgi:hypothetical protein
MGMVRAATLTLSRHDRDADALDGAKNRDAGETHDR